MEPIQAMRNQGQKEDGINSEAWAVYPYSFGRFSSAWPTFVSEFMRLNSLV